MPKPKTTEKTLVPLHDRILVRPQPPKETAGSSGLIVRPDSAKEEPVIGTVVAVGAGAPMLNGGGVHAPCVKPGDTILFERFVGIEYMHNEDAPGAEKFVIIADSEILLVIR